MKIFNYEIPRKDLIIVLDITLIVITFNIFCLLYKISSVDFIEMLHILLNPILPLAIVFIVLLKMSHSLFVNPLTPVILSPLTFIYYFIIYSVFKHLIKKVRKNTEWKKRIIYILIIIGVILLIFAFVNVSLFIGMWMAMVSPGYT
jgi:hypothetical protein